MSQPSCRYFVVSVCFLAATFEIVSADDAPPALLQRAHEAAGRRDSEQAVEWATRAIEADPALAQAYYTRGRELFRLGRIDASVRDLDHFVTLRPDLESRQWERGIAYYYAGQFAKGARQFELYQTYHDGDVENSAWRFLCLARHQGVAEARAKLLPIRHDRRVPMMQILDLYRGRLEPSDVIAAARAGQPGKEELAGRLFYAHLYIGLYLDVTGIRQDATRYLKLAADSSLSDNRFINRYMWDVARVHQQRARKPAAGRRD